MFDLELYEQQYQLGLEMESKYGDDATYRKMALYSQGVGASALAYKAAKSQEIDKAKLWAHHAVEAWEKYNALMEYYNAYVHYSLALGALGHTSKMEAAMIKGASLVNSRPSEHPEFVEVNEKLRAIEPQGGAVRGPNIATKLSLLFGCWLKGPKCHLFSLLEWTQRWLET